MTGLCFVDTNLLVYARVPAERDKHRLAQAWMAMLWQSRRGRLSHQVLREYYQVMTRRLLPAVSAATAQEETRDLFAWRPVPESLSLFLDAWRIEARYQLSWWDSLIVASAQTASCSWLLSEDLQEGQDFEGTVVVNPLRTSVDAFAQMQRG